MSQDKALIHLASEFAPDTGQRCVICGHTLVMGLGSMAWAPGQKTPRHWREGALVLVSGSFTADVSRVADLAIKARRCTSEDGPAEEDEPEWRT